VGRSWRRSGPAAGSLAQMTRPSLSQANRLMVATVPSECRRSLYYHVVIILAAFPTTIAALAPEPSVESHDQQQKAR